MRSTTTLLDTESATRLRAVIGRLSRELRPTPSGQEAALTPTRISLMLTIDRTGPVRLGELADVEGINPTMLSRSVAQLVDAGLVARTCDTDDRRAAWVSATEAGHGLAERMRQERTEAINEALAGLEAADRRTLEQAIPALEALARELKGRRP
ncbi:MAG TPA: MarR family transcriptional regulator [Solirubrobacteraceae bacterium]|nr:MarR family transcriptional regulator [Solirubrobacteraceae bacterium]